MKSWTAKPEAKVAPPPVTLETACVTCNSLAEIQDLWDRGGFTPAFDKAVAEIKRLNKIIELAGWREEANQ